MEIELNKIKDGEFYRIELRDEDNKDDNEFKIINDIKLTKKYLFS